MGNNEKLEKWLSEHDGEDYCKYCDYGCETTGVRADGDGNPIYPPCADWDDNDVIEHLDTEAILQDIMEEEDDSLADSGDKISASTDYIMKRFMQRL